MNKITCIVGLPGSGKSYLANKMLNKNNDILLLDDISNNKNGLKELTLAVQQKKDIIIIDVNFCDDIIQKKANLKIEEQIDYNYSIDWIYFENNPINCLKNVIFRNDHRKVKPTINRFTKIYNPPQNSILVLDYQEELNQKNVGLKY